MDKRESHCRYLPYMYISLFGLHPPFTRSRIVPGFPHRNRCSRTRQVTVHPHRNCARCSHSISRSNLHPPFTRSCIVPGFPHHNRRSRTLSYLSPARSGFPHRNCARRKRATHSPVGQIYTRRLPALVRNSSTQRANGFAAP